MKQLAFDVEAVREIGLAEWRNHAIVLVGDEEYAAFCRDVRLRYVDLLRGENGESGAVLRDLAVIDAGFLLQLIFIAHALATHKRCLDGGYEPVLGGAKTLLDPDWTTLSASVMPPLSAGVSERARRPVKNVLLNRRLPMAAYLRGFVSSNAAGLGSRSKLKSDFALKNGWWLDNHTFPTLFGIEAGPAPLPGDCTSALKLLMNDVARIVHDHFGVAFPAESALDAWTKRLERLYGVYSAAMSHKQAPSRLLIAEAGRPLHKLAACVARRRGSEVYGFNHGNQMGWYVRPTGGYDLECAYGGFVCETEAAAAAHQRNYDATPGAASNPVRFASARSMAFAELHASIRSALPKSIRKVMLIGFPMNSYRYVESPGYFCIQQLDLELRLLQFLKDMGLTTLYKAHPDRLEECKGLFGDVCDQVLPQPFEDVWPQADALLFKYTGTSTFGYSLCTNRPIVLLDYEKAHWAPEHFALLSKRCSIIASRADERNRILFDEDALRDALTTRPAQPDQSYFDAFMRPEGSEQGRS